MTLHGRHIAVTGYDLEQSEHRGIATYSKNLIRCLQMAGASVWLITETDPRIKRRGTRQLPFQTQEFLQQFSALKQLASTTLDAPQNALEKQFRPIFVLRLLIQRMQRHGLLQLPLIPYRPKPIIRISLRDQLDTPYQRDARLKYLQDIEGIICIPGFFKASHWRNLKPVKLSLPDFDTLITTCPLNLTCETPTQLVQTVHDLIPLECDPENRNTLVFTKRLQACLASQRIHISSTTQAKYNKYIYPQNKSHQKQQNKQSTRVDEIVIIQPPSLQIPSEITTHPLQEIDLEPGSDLFQKNQEQAVKTNQGTSTRLDPPKYSQPRNTTQGGLEPFRYFLFNSSIEARKNLLFLAKAYYQSNLKNHGIKLCVTGKFKDDAYSRAVRKQAIQESGIILTGYVDESTKLDLYLNAIGLVSPSLIEGFGIPVFDSACLGLHTIASDCASHLEISQLHDFCDYITPLSTLESRDWALTMRALAEQHCDLWRQAPAERCRRLKRYTAMASGFDQQFQHDLERLLI